MNSDLVNRYIIRHFWNTRKFGELRGAVVGNGICMLLVAVLAGCSPAPSETLEMEDAWVRAMPDGTQMSAAYGTLHWHGSEHLVIAGWESDAYADVSLHRTVERDGVSRMEAVGEAVIAPGSTLVLAPGGMHLMLMRPTRKLVPGDTVAVMLISDSGESFRFVVPVEAR